MIPKNQIITDLKIESVKELYKLKPFFWEGVLKINKSHIARESEIDRRTVDKYISGYTKPETRNYKDCITPFYDIITELLSDKNQHLIACQQRRARLSTAAHEYASFILNVDWLGWLCYFSGKQDIYYFFLISFNFIFLLSAIFRNTSTTNKHCALSGSEDNSSLDCICFIASCISESSNKLTATQKKFFLRPSL